MDRKPPITRPAYAVTSVDNALRLLQMLRDGGRVHVSDAAQELGIAPSTAHRLLSMLVYRGFAVRLESRGYAPGPGLGATPTTTTWTRTLRAACRPHLEALAARVGETVNLLFRVGGDVRFLESVEGGPTLRIADRAGAVLAASRASGGKALLAELEDGMLQHLYRGRAAEVAGRMMTEAQFDLLRRELARVRRDGFALNREETERGVWAMGMALHDRDGLALAAFSIALPASRSAKLHDATTVRAAEEARSDIEAALAASSVTAQGTDGLRTP